MNKKNRLFKIIITFETIFIEKGRITMKWFSNKWFYILGITFLCGGLHAQSLAEAKKLYNEGKYEEAKPVFQKLVKQSPSNSSYNQWYGVCCFETGDLENAEKYLKIAQKRKVMNSYSYLAKIYYKTYRFDLAGEVLEEYIELLEKKKQDTEAAEAILALADDAQRMVEKVEDVQIIDSMVVNKSDILTAYTLSEESGTLNTYSTFFQTNEPIHSTVYKNQKGDKIYYAQPTEEGNYSLFTQSMLMDQWGDEKLLPMNNEKNKDDNYPFVLSDGATIYFASNGNGSIGGYDLFVTRYNTNSDSFLTPEQLGMPFNSPYNDYMIVFDEVKGLGWFVSDRFQPEDQVCVYLFIPNPDHKRIETEDLEIKQARASIRSIQDSWQPDANYTEMIALAHKEIPYGNVEIKKDFEFIIGDNIVYYRWDEIQSPEAKAFYEKHIAVNKQINALSQKLEGLRTAYTQGNKTRKEQLKQTILQTEAQLETLLDQPAEYEKKARNAEVIYLKKKQ
jgi:tetratricopeptide (TPR) repeat protein